MNKEKQQKLLNIVKSNYEDIAADFDTTRKKFLWPALVEYAAQVKDGDKVLDVGCGNGRLLRALDGKAVEFVGTDQSVNLIELAKQNSLLASKEIKAEFLVSDILNLDKDISGRFDWIFSIAVVHHLPSQELRLKAMKNLKSKLGSDGRLVISVWRPWGNKKLVRELLRTIGNKLMGRHPYAWNDLVFIWKNNQSARYYHFFSRFEIKRLCRQAGLEIIDFKVEKRNYFLLLK